MLVNELTRAFPDNTVRGKECYWLSAEAAPFSVFGVFFEESEGGYVRMPPSAAKEVSEGALMLNGNTAGGRVRFCTDSPFITLSATQENTVLLPHIPLCSQSGFALYDENGYVGTFMPKMNIKNGYAASLATDGKMHCYTVYFPLYDNVKKLFIGLADTAQIEPAKPYKNQKPMVFYGSSITQGASASHSGNCYTARVARAFDSDFINLGLAANCHGEREMAEYLGSLDASVLFICYDHNCKTPDELKKNHLAFYETVRSKNKDVPIVFLSAPDILLKKGEFSVRRDIVKSTYGTAVSRGDKNVFFIGGETLFEGNDFDTCTVDGTHPNDLGFSRIANRIIEFLRSNGNVF